MTHPYADIPDRQRWSRTMAGRASSEIDPAGPPPFRIQPADKVVSAGSCFAQHVARYLRELGRPCFESEPPHPLLPADVARQYNYGVYTARYGNVYTSRQLLQLWRRADGQFRPRDDAWRVPDAWFDPFRPTIQPGGFPTRQEYDLDREQHMKAVRTAFETMDVFIFTLGLTECWISREDGAAYPICPGVAAGTFDPARHELLNLTVDDVVADMTAFIGEVRTVNPNMRLVLTVSPVPLAATAEPTHVLSATTYSKSVLRVAAEQVARLPMVYYFPSYEIVTTAGPAWLAPDRRSVLEPAVGHVMSVFFRHLVEGAALPQPEVADDFLANSQLLVDTLCDEALLDEQDRSQGATDGSEPG
ncbi:MAG: GSCFA domain-containing protein [Rhizobiaceae bacterium]